MFGTMKNFVYLQRLIHTNAGTLSAMQSVTGFFNALRAAYMSAVYQPRERSIMGFSSAFDGLDSGKWHTAFLVPQSKNRTK